MPMHTSGDQENSGQKGPRPSNPGALHKGKMFHLNSGEPFVV